jgi:predicted ArsR family transcriptional regulator
MRRRRAPLGVLLDPLVFPAMLCENGPVDLSSRPGDVLAQPTRARLFALLNDLRRPASTEELAQRLELHPNGVRVHLDRLHAAGLLTRERERQARGRPRDAWAISADAQPGGHPPTAYAELARWLVRSLEAEGAGAAGVEAVGREIGREIAASGGTGDEQHMYDALAALGFQPIRDTVADDRLVYRLRNCPYRDAVHEHQPLVCGLHRGMTLGMLDTLDHETELTGFVPKDPDVAGCLIALRGPLAARVAR